MKVQTNAASRQRVASTRIDPLGWVPRALSKCSEGQSSLTAHVDVLQPRVTADVQVTRGDKIRVGGMQTIVWYPLVALAIKPFWRP